MFLLALINSSPTSLLSKQARMELLNEDGEPFPDGTPHHVTCRAALERYEHYYLSASYTATSPPCGIPFNPIQSQVKLTLISVCRETLCFTRRWGNNDGTEDAWGLEWMLPHIANAREIRIRLWKTTQPATPGELDALATGVEVLDYPDAEFDDELYIQHLSHAHTHTHTHTHAHHTHTHVTQHMVEGVPPPPNAHVACGGNTSSTVVHH